MVDAFVEGVRSIVQVCHLVILAPVALTIVAARGRWEVTLGAVAGVVVGGWFFVSNRFGAISETELRITASLVIVIVVALGAPAVFDRDRPRLMRAIGSTVQSPLVAGVLSAVVAMMVTQWWRPCVGEELGSLLTNAPSDPWGQLFPTVGFMTGIAVPLVILGLIYGSVEPPLDVASKLGWIGSGLCVALAVSVIAGQHGEIVSRLFQWSQ
ncbi:MAG: hypothetical protein AB8G14_01975 [Ilumatobacter sp.]